MPLASGKYGSRDIRCASTVGISSFSISQSLGIHLDVRHFAATPIGMRVRATAELVGVDGRTLSFRVEARDDKEPIGDGSHQRVVVNVARFDERVKRKLGA
jgi:predicted thioesterase